MGQEVVAVEPDPLMRQRLSAATPGVDVVDGRAEAMPLPDGRLDGVLAGQAYHWFDREAAHAELARVIRPGGVFAAVWNERDTTVPWIWELSRIIDPDRRRRRFSGRDVASYGGGHNQDARAEVEHAVDCTPDLLVNLVQTRSYFLTGSPRRQAEQTTAVRRLTEEHPDLAGAAQFPLPYVTEVFRARRR